MSKNLIPQYCLTGNIGSGKTTVAREFERLGIPVYYADAAAKRLMNNDKDLKSALVASFGEASYRPDGQLNRPYLAKVAFTDESALAKLNGLVHPAVHRDASAWQDGQKDVPYTLYEAAITLELGRRDDFAGIIVVHAPVAERQRRVQLRDGVTAEQFTDRASKQWPDDKKLAAADYVVRNTGSDLLFPQILHLHGRLAH
ncbi:dephospho-CoA kinase [Neolewinella antarctica]|uniref:Dephospho-CoA kinase n=1 Tax=Neolewinella antarctica TaxID=442734 RepID=A0ABX0X5U0_9BACT|nr:dephospho-CoA kinase [Neolewinella antarctica]NJC24565.1 dephospho-CoA kinase [Neolewinella antarctica]